MSEPNRNLVRSAPYFPVPDVQKAAKHYESVFGFKTEYAGGPEFAILSRDGFAIMLRRVSDPARISPNERQGGTWDAFFWATDVDSLYRELQSSGADVVYAPMQTEYGMREFAVRDPDGYVLGFGQST